MVKPAGLYLDILAGIREFGLPVAAYQVSGEYSQIKAAGEKGWINEKAVALESRPASSGPGPTLSLPILPKMRQGGWMKSSELFERARGLMPGGVSSPVRAITPFPFYTKEAAGSTLTTVDGTELIDCCMAYGPLILGHAHPEIRGDIGPAREGVALRYPGANRARICLARNRRPRGHGHGQVRLERLGGHDGGHPPGTGVHR